MMLVMLFSLWAAVAVAQQPAALLKEGKVQEAIEMAEAQLASARQTAPDSPAHIQALLQLANIYYPLGRLRETEPLVRELLAVQTRVKAAPAQLGQAYSLNGSVDRDRGDFAQARANFSRAYDLLRGVLPADDPNLGATLNNLGLAAQGQRDFVAAEDFYRQALRIREKAGETVDLARLLNNFATVLQEQGKLDEAAPLYARAVAIHETAKTTATALYGQTINNQAVLYLLKKEFDTAGPLYERAIDVREKALGSFHREVATAYASYAIYLHARQRFDDAMAAQARATDIVERNLASVLETGSELQQQRYIELFADYADITMSMRATANRASANDTATLFVLRRKGRLQEVLASSTDAIRAANPGAPQADLAELARLRDEHARLELGLHAEKQATAISDITKRIEAVETRVAGAGASAGRRSVEVSVDAVSRALPAGSVLLEFFRYRPFDAAAIRIDERFGAPRYAAFALRPGATAQWVELGDANAIDTRVAELRAALLNPQRGDFVPRAAALRDALTTRVETLIGDARTVFVAPDGDLNLLPFQALTDGDGRFLVHRYLFTYLTTGRDLLVRAGTSTSTASVVISNPEFGAAQKGGGLMGRTFAPLAGAAREGSDVAALLRGATLMTGSNASEAAVKKVRGPSVLHFATHGFFLDGGRTPAASGARSLKVVDAGTLSAVPVQFRSGLALAGVNGAPSASGDGILTAAEAALLDLQGTELVFLSACDTGLGVVNAGESVYGLRRAFVIAGARSQVLTLWAVNDRATREFVNDFYRRIVAGESRSSALRAAQQAALKDPARRHPFYWAPFIFSGADGPLAPQARGAR